MQLTLCVLMLESSHCPDGRLTFCSLLQGGGVRVQGGTVSIVNSQIYSNTAGSVRASHACKLPIAPMGNLLTRLCLDSRLATVADAPVNYRMYVPQRT